MEPYRVRLFVGNDTTSRLLVGIASFASALIASINTGHRVGLTSDNYYTLSPDIQALGIIYKISCTSAPHQGNTLCDCYIIIVFMNGIRVQT